LQHRTQETDSGNGFRLAIVVKIGSNF
jgi:hypothetical protein